MAKKLGASSRAFLHGAALRPAGPRSIAWGLATVALSLGPGLAHAQGRPAALGGPDRPLTIGVQAVTTYDSNPARGSAVAGEIRDVQKDEIIFSPSVTVGYSHSVGLQGLALTGVFGYDKYTKNTNLSAEHIDFSAMANRALGAHCSVNGDFAYNRGQSNLENVSVLVSKNVVQTYDLRAGETCGTATGLTQSLNFTRGSTHNSDSSLVDFDSTGVSGSLGYSNQVLGNVGLVASYVRTSYASVPALSLGTPDSLGLTSIGVQISRPIGARLSGSAAVSYSRSHQELRQGAPAASKSSYSGLTASAALTYLVGPRLQLMADVSRDVTGSILQDVGYTVRTQAGLTADYTVSSRISASLGGGRSRDSYRGRIVNADFLTPDWQETSNVFGRVSVQLGRRATVALDVRHEWGASDIALYDYSSNRVALTLAASL